jgi:hypothetical protein
MIPDLTAWTPDDFGAASGVGTLLVAAGAAFIALRQLRQARELREEEAAPYIVIDVLPGRGWMLDIAIENIGKTVGRNVRITFDPPVSSTLDGQGYDLADWAPLNQVLDTFAPGRRLTALFDAGPARHQAGLPTKYDVKISCSDSRGRPQPTVHQVVDLAPLYGRMHIAEKGVHDLVKEVEKLRSAVEKITARPLTVETYDGETMDARREEQHEEWRRQVQAIEEREAAARAQEAGEPAAAQDADAPEETPPDDPASGPS